MEVEGYNKGRGPKDVSDKTWIDGTRHHLRPDTMWPDTRYATITQAEINEAKKRYEAREAAKEKKVEGKKEDHHHGNDFVHVPYKQAKPLYP